MTDVQPSNKTRNIKIFIRVMNIVSALVLIGFGIAGMIFMIVNQLAAGRFFLIFSPIFMILFGLMLIAAEFKIKFITKHFGFLNSFLGRGIFNFYLASAVFFYFSCGNNNDVVGWIAAIIIFVLGFVYCIMHFCVKKQDEPQTDTKQQMM